VLNKTSLDEVQGGPLTELHGWTEAGDERQGCREADANTVSASIVEWVISFGGREECKHIVIRQRMKQ
jgi:hypothetical protein